MSADFKKPLPVRLRSEDAADILHKITDTGNIAANASLNYDVKVPNGEIWEIWAIYTSASVVAKCELLIGDGALAETFTSKHVMFSTGSNLEMARPLVKPIVVAGTINQTTIRMRVTNRGALPASIYPAFTGVKIKP